MGAIVHGERQGSNSIFLPDSLYWRAFSDFLLHLDRFDSPLHGWNHDQYCFRLVAISSAEKPIWPRVGIDLVQVPFMDMVASGRNERIILRDNLC